MQTTPDDVGYAGSESDRANFGKFIKPIPMGNQVTSIYISIYMCVCMCVCVCVYIYIYVCMYVYILLHRHVPSGLAGCGLFPSSPPVNAGHRRWLWFGDAI